MKIIIGNKRVLFKDLSMLGYRQWLRGLRTSPEVVAALEKYNIPEYDESLNMEIGAANAPADPQKIIDLAAAGFTVLLPDNGQMNFSSDPQGALLYLNRAHQAGIKVVLNDSGFCHSVWDSALGGSTQYDAPVKDNVHIYKNHPAFYGISIADEPQVCQFKMQKQKFDDFKAEFQGKLGMMNICPYRKKFYESYVDEYMRTIQPQLLSYNDYAILDPARKGGITVRIEFFKFMAFIKAKAVQYGVPAHIYILTVGHKGESWYRNPSQEELRWQVAALMTYGYEAFSHFNTAPSDETYSSLWENNGAVNYLYRNVQTVNCEVHKWAYVYMSFCKHWKGVIPIVGEHRDPGVLFEMINNAKLSLVDVEGVKNIISNQNLLLGVFEDGNKNKGFMITNAANPFYKIAAKVTIEFDSAYKGLLAFEFGEPRIYNLNDGKITLELEAGEGRFLIPLMRKNK